MLIITEAARQKISALMAQSPKPVKGLRVGAQARSPLKVDFRLAFMAEGQEKPEDAVLHFEGFDVYMDPESAPHLEEASIDFVEGLMGSGFKVERPRQLPPGLSGTLVEKVQEVLDQHINPAVASHGGYVSLIDIKDRVVYVELSGGCQGCGRANITLKQGIEAMIKEAVPEIAEVYDVTDHANGQNPYYQTAG